MMRASMKFIDEALNSVPIEECLLFYLQSVTVNGLLVWIMIPSSLIVALTPAYNYDSMHLSKIVCNLAAYDLDAAVAHSTYYRVSNLTYGRSAMTFIAASIDNALERGYIAHSKHGATSAMSY
eukprot:IDg4178t1